jgi:hypothetical protein
LEFVEDFVNYADILFKHLPKVKEWMVRRGALAPPPPPPPPPPRARLPQQDAAGRTSPA